MRDFIRLLFKHKTTILVCFTIIFGITIMKLLFSPPLFKATVLLKFEARKEPVSLQEERIDITQSMQLVKSHKIKIKSRPVLKAVIENLDLTEKKSFMPPQIEIPPFFRTLFIKLFPQFNISESGIVIPKELHHRHLGTTNRVKPGILDLARDVKPIPQLPGGQAGQ